MTRQGFVIAIGIKAGAIALGLLLLGIPGAVIFEISKAILRPAFGPNLRIAPDAEWPIAIYMSVLWPAAILPVAYVASRLFGPERRGARAATVLLLLAAWGVLLSAAFIAMGRQS